MSEIDESVARSKMLELVSRAIAVQQGSPSEEWDAFTEVGDAVLSALGLNDSKNNPKCPRCNRTNKIVWGRYGAFFACPRSSQKDPHPTHNIDRTVSAGVVKWASPVPPGQTAETHEDSAGESDS